MAQTHLIIVALAQHTHFAMSHACIILLHNVGIDCASVLSAVGSAPEEYDEYLNEDQYQTTDLPGKQPPI